MQGLRSWAHRLRSAVRDPSERGASMLGILSVVAILGVLATIVLSSNFGGTPTTTSSSPKGVVTTTVPSTPASAASEAIVSGCQANFATVEQAIQTYRALNGVNPPAGNAWSVSTSNNGPFLQSWPSEPGYYALTWSGSVLSVVPVRGRASHGSFGLSTPASGCFAK